jgi:predicted oxidoreductase
MARPSLYIAVIKIENMLKRMHGIITISLLNQCRLNPVFNSKEVTDTVKVMNNEGKVKHIGFSGTGNMDYTSRLAFRLVCFSRSGCISAVFELTLK